MVFLCYVEIDVAKEKPDCFITNSDGEVLVHPFSFPNNADDFESLCHTISSCSNLKEETKIGLEATGHYSNNILDFLLAKGFQTYLMNPLSTNLYRKGRSLRKTKTDRSDARFITMMLMTEDLKPYSSLSYSGIESINSSSFPVST